MTDLRTKVKNVLGMTNYDTGYSDLSRETYFMFYLNYFRDMIINFYKWENLPDGVDSSYIEETLFNNGYAGLVFNETLGYLILNGAFTGDLNVYNKPMRFRVNPKNRLDFGLSKTYECIYDNYDLEHFSSNSAIILGNNYRFSSYKPQILMFASKLSDIEMSIDLNRRAQLTPYVFKTTNKNYLTVKNVFNQVSTFKPVINIKEDELDNIEVLNLNAPFLLDKLHDEKNRVISQCLNFIGLNSNAIDKAERLVRAEANANNAEIQSNIEIGLRARQKFCEIANRCFNLNISVDVSRRIDTFNDGETDFDFSGGGVNEM